MWSLQETTAAAKSWNRKSVAYRALSVRNTRHSICFQLSARDKYTEEAVKTAASFPLLVMLESSLAVNMAPSCWASIELS